MKVLLPLLLAGASLHAADVNLALKKKVTLHTEPNYTLSTDARDALQLTDGRRSASSPTMWTNKDSVTWQNRRQVVVSVDLEKEENIGKVRFSTGSWGPASVSWPLELAVFLSEDEKVWHYAGDIINDETKANRFPSGEPTEKRKHVFESDSLLIPARYVAIVARGIPFLTCDEIEVIGAPDNGKQLQALPSVDGVAGMEKAFQELLTWNGLQERLAADRSALTEKIQASTLDEAQKKSLLQQLSEAPAELEAFGKIDPVTFRTVFPINEEHRRIFETQARLWQAQGAKSPGVWTAHRYAWIEHLHDLPIHPALVTMEWKLLKGEKRGEIVLLSNPTDAPMTFRIRPPAELRGAISLWSSLWTDTYEMKPVADALMPLGVEGEDFTVTVPSGLTTKLWVGMDSSKLAPGRHEGTLSVQAEGFSKDVGLDVRVSPVALHDSAFALGMWDYLLAGALYGVTEGNRAASLEFVRQNGVNVAWIPPGIIPWLKPDEIGSDGAPKAPPNFKPVTDRINKLWPDADYYMFFLATNKTFAGTQVGTDLFNERFGLWVKELEKAVIAAGIPPEKVFILSVDEPANVEKAETSAAWTRATKAAGTKIRTFTDPPILDDFDNIPKEYIDLAEVVCPNAQIVAQSSPAEQTYYDSLAAKDHELWYYICSGPTRIADPVSYYRMMHWFSYLHGGKGVGFWSWGDIGGATTSWNEYTRAGMTFAPLFLGTDSIDRSIHWESIAEGQQDVRIFRMLEEAGKTHPEFQERISAWKDQCRAQLARFAQAHRGSNLKSGFWWENHDQTPVDKVREDAIQLLEEIENKKSN